MSVSLNHQRATSPLKQTRSKKRVNELRQADKKTQLQWKNNMMKKAVPRYLNVIIECKEPALRILSTTRKV